MPLDSEEIKKRYSSRDVDRREFLKFSGAMAAVLGGSGLGMFGYAAGKDPRTYTGTESFQGTAQTFDRVKHAVRGAAHDKVGPTSRVGRGTRRRGWTASTIISESIMRSTRRISRLISSSAARSTRTGGKTTKNTGTGSSSQRRGPMRWARSGPRG